MRKLIYAGLLTLGLAVTCYKRDFNSGNNDGFFDALRENENEGDYMGNVSLIQSKMLIDDGPIETRYFYRGLLGHNATRAYIDGEMNDPELAYVRLNDALTYFSDNPRFFNDRANLVENYMVWLDDFIGLGKGKLEHLERTADLSDSLTVKRIAYTLDEMNKPIRTAFYLEESGMLNSNDSRLGHLGFDYGTMLLTKSEIQGSFGNNLVAYGYLYDACSAFGNVRNRFPDLYNDRSEEFALRYGKTIDDLCTMGVGS